MQRFRRPSGIVAASVGVLTLLGMMANLAGCSCGADVQFTPSKDHVTITADGKPIAVYRHDESLTKPVLHPVYSPSGEVVNRTYPLGEVEGESKDHPHQVGVFFTYDDVNGVGFWNNTTAPPRIKHLGFTKVRRGYGKGTLGAILHWIDKDGAVLLVEERTMEFRVHKDAYLIDFNIELRAVRESVTFGDTKEGMLAIRVADWLREKGGTGKYLNAQGQRNAAKVWGKRSAWMQLEGQKENTTVGVAILNHPESVNYPTFWFARGYGLFAANPLGQHAFERALKVDNAQPLHLKLAPNEKALFKFRMIIYEGQKDQEAMEAEFADYTKREPVKTTYHEEKKSVEE